VKCDGGVLNFYSGTSEFFQEFVEVPRFVFFFRQPRRDETRVKGGI
jgi:hypothetical protein